MTRRLTRLAEICCKHRGRMVLALDRRHGRDHRRGLLARGRVRGRLRHPGLGVEGGQRPHRAALRGLLRPGDLRRLEGSGRARTVRPPRAADKFFAQAEKVKHVGKHAPIRVSEDGKIGSTTLPLTVPGWEVKKEDGEKLIEAAEQNSGDGAPDQARRRPDLRRAGGGQPRGARLPRRRDRAADRLRLGRGGRAAAGDRAGRPGHLVGRADRPARQRRRRPRLDHRRLGPDRDRRRHRLRAAGPDPLPLGDEGRQDPPRRDRRVRHHRRAQRDHRRRHRGDRRARPVPHRPALHVRRRDLGVARGAGRDARRRHPAAGAARLPGPPGRQPADPVPRRGARKGRTTATRPPRAGATRSSAARGPSRSSPRRCCSRSPRRRSACGSASPTPATTRPTR